MLRPLQRVPAERLRQVVSVGLGGVAVRRVAGEGVDTGGVVTGNVDMVGVTLEVLTWEMLPGRSCRGRY